MQHVDNAASTSEALTGWQQIVNYFSEADFMPHGHCYLWKPGLVYTHVISDFLIGTAYALISLTLYGLVKKINLGFNRVVLCFGVFIGACGWTHFNEIWNLWYSDYWYSGVVKVLTATASVGTGVYLIKLRHPIFQVAKAAKLSEQRRLDLEALTHELEDRVKERTKTIAENEKRLRLAQDVANIGTFEWDIKTKIHNWTPELGKLYGLPPGSFDRTLEHWQSLVYPDDLPGVELAINSALEKGFFESQWRVIWPDGSVHWLSGRGIVEKDENGNPLKMVGVNIDITKNKNLELERDKLISELKGAVVARDEFISIASHELKTPLTSLSLQTQIMKREKMKPESVAFSKERVDKLVDQNEKHVQRLNRLVDDMLDISRIRTGKLTIEKSKFNICDLIKEVCDRLSLQFDDFQVEFQQDLCEDYLVSWDKLRIEQVMTNLLNNSIKYGEEKPVSVRVSQRENKILISIKDQGMGIAKENQSRIFNRFERSISAYEVSGMGLGLYICKEIVKAHRGHIWVESELGEGATFFVELPVK